MGALKATAQALMTVVAVAIAIARHLVNHGGGLSRCLIGFALGGHGQSVLVELLLREDGSKLGAFGRWRIMIGRHRVGSSTRPLGIGNAARENEGNNSQRIFHMALI